MMAILVVLLFIFIEHNAQGAMGLVLTKTTDLSTNGIMYQNEFYDG